MPTLGCDRTMIHLLALIAAQVAFSQGAQGAGGPTFVNLGVLPGGAYSFGIAVSSDGTSVTGSSYSSNGVRAFRWTNGNGMQSLGVLPGAASSAGCAISGDGSAVAGYSSATTLQPDGSTITVNRAFRWTQAGGMQDLGVRPGGVSSVGYGISGDGSVVVGYGDSSIAPHSSNTHAFRWTTTGGMADLGTVPGFQFSYGTAISGDASAVAGRVSSLNQGRAFRFTSGGGLVDLGVLPGSAYADAASISGDGSAIAGSSSAPNNYYRAYRWTSTGGMRDLGVLPGGLYSRGYAISGDGEAVAGTAELAGESRAFIWRRSLGMVELKAYLTSLGVNLSGWTLTDARGLSADGSAITGAGTINGVYRAWLITGVPVCRTADIGSAGGVVAPDGRLDNNDFVAFVGMFFGQAPMVDRGGAAGLEGPDGAFDNNDVVVFIDQFFSGCV